MRIISGKFRSKRIIAPGNLPVRPTTDFAKTALFNLLTQQFELSQVVFLDLFCGTGNISFEMISRGCTQIFAVDTNSNCLHFVKKVSVEQLKSDIHTTRYEAIRFVNSCTVQFDIIFADPPYEYENRTLLVNTIFQKKVLRKDGIFVLEHPKGEKYDSFKEFKECRSYGAVQFSFFENKSY